MWQVLDLVIGKHFHTNFKSQADFFLVYGGYKINIASNHTQKICPSIPIFIISMEYTQVASFISLKHW
jgi:hypothetical protein